MKKFLTGIGAIFLLNGYAIAQIPQPGVDGIKPQPALNFLSIVPDAASSAKGLTGVSTDADGVAIFHNPGKLAYMSEFNYGFVMGYVPWMPKAADAMGLAAISGYRSIGGESSVVGFDIRYFSMGKIDFLDENGYSLYNYAPAEYTFGLTYSQKIAENISLGSTLRYIHSSPGPKVNLSGQLIRPISSVGGDIGVYYTTRSSFRGVDDANDGSINLGLAIRNLGSKITYYDGSRSTQQPTLVVGGITYHFPSDGENRISLSGEAGKTLQTGAQVSGGFEYGYRNMFYARAGIHYEPKQWSAQQLYTFGVGIKTEILDFDISYYQPFSKLENPAYGQILKIGFSFNFIDGKIIGGRYD